jgi:macrolide transport system ATP-binding/permease protein
VHGLWQDLKYGGRLLLQHRGFTAVAVLSLALGIGANTTIFSLLNAVLLRPIPVEDVDSLASVFTSYTGGDRYSITSYPDYADLRDRNEVFSELAAQAFMPMGLRGTRGTDVVMGQLVSWNYFSLLGVEPALGRSFRPEEDQTEGTHPVAILSHRIWHADFDADPDTIGQQIFINDYPFTVIGVAPEGFRGLSVILAPDIWVPLHMTEQALPYTPQFEGRIDPWLWLVGRLSPGVSLEQAQAALEVLSANLSQEYPELNQNKRFEAIATSENRIGMNPSGGANGFIWMLLGVVGLVLLVATFNVANLHLARATIRQREIALRYSLGASRGRILRQLLTESVVLALLAGLVGLLIALWATDLLMALVPPSVFTFEIDYSFDWAVLGFTLIISLLAGALFGMAPALQTIHPDQAGELKEQSVQQGRSLRKSRLQRSLIVAQVALSLLLLISAGLFLKSLTNLVALDPGYDLRNGIVASVNLGYSQYEEADGRMLYQRFFDRIRALPGVEQVSMSAFLPLGENHGRHDTYIDGYEFGPDEYNVFLRNMVSPEYFETMGIALLQGRSFDHRDRQDGKPVALINETMAGKYWPDRDPVGSRIFVDFHVEREVVGVVEDGKYLALLEEPQPYVYIPLSQAEYLEHLNFVVRSDGDASALVGLVQQEFGQVEPNLPPPLIQTVEEYMRLSVGDARAPTLLIGAFGLLALILAMTGIYGVMAYMVSQRTHEFGVRTALGADSSQIVLMVLRRGMRTTLVGIAVGLVLAAAATRLLAGFLYEVSPLDPLVYLTVALALALVSIVACLVPARLASRVDPMVALRVE